LRYFHDVCVCVSVCLVNLSCVRAGCVRCGLQAPRWCGVCFCEFWETVLIEKTF
jgi:hypothetical protein